MNDIREKAKKTIEDIKKVYRDIDRPWVVGYSGGKDSTCTLQLVWEALAELDEQERNRKIFVISSDTMIETPMISKYIRKIISAINKGAKKQNLPISAHCLFPQIQDTFWVNLLGRGYPAPRTRFRWCTDRLKIRPANRFILDVVTQYGEAIIVLGTRKEESASRSQVISKHQNKKYITAGNFLPRHSNLPNSYVFTPIVDWTTNEVWKYLLNDSITPWGESNKDLETMYKDSTANDGLIVLDKNSPPAGNTRFGCWVCTVVEQNKSLENVIASGQEWLKPLLRFRNMLMETTEPGRKAKYRSHKRRDGHVKLQQRTINGEIAIIRGPYKFEYRKQFLSELLKAQEELNENNSGERIELITEEELKLIRAIWTAEEKDWQDSVPKIYKEVTGRDLNWGVDDTAIFGIEELDLLEKICHKSKVPTGLVARLIDKEREFNAMGRRSTLTRELDSILREEWRTEDKIVQAYKTKNENQ